MKNGGEKMTVGEKIKELRKKRKLSQEQLEARCGISQSAISAIEKGQRSPTLDTLTLIAAGLRVSVIDLTEDTKKEEPAFDLSGLDKELVNLLVNLPDKDVQRVKDFVRGMKATRGE